MIITTIIPIATLSPYQSSFSIVIISHLGVTQRSYGWDYIYMYIYIIHDSRHILINGWFNPTKKSTFFAGEIPTLTETTTYRKPRAVHAPAYWEHISSLGADFFKLTRNDLTAEGARNCGSVDINGHL
jgi:hypothetical protein